MSKTIYVEVAIRLSDEVDIYEAIEDCDYSFTGEGILSHEIVGIVDSCDKAVF